MEKAQSLTPDKPKKQQLRSRETMTSEESFRGIPEE